jgi:hypothetical protein
MDAVDIIVIVGIGAGVLASIVFSRAWKTGFASWRESSTGQRVSDEEKPKKTGAGSIDDLVIWFKDQRKRAEELKRAEERERDLAVERARMATHEPSLAEIDQVKALRDAIEILREASHRVGWSPGTEERANARIWHAIGLLKTELLEIPWAVRVNIPNDRLGLK